LIKNCDWFLAIFKLETSIIYRSVVLLFLPRGTKINEGNLAELILLFVQLTISYNCIINIFWNVPFSALQTLTWGYKPILWRKAESLWKFSSWIPSLNQLRKRLEHSGELQNRAVCVWCWWVHEVFCGCFVFSVAQLFNCRAIKIEHSSKEVLFLYPLTI